MAEWSGNERQIKIELFLHLISNMLKGDSIAQWDQVLQGPIQQNWVTKKAPLRPLLERTYIFSPL